MAKPAPGTRLEVTPAELLLSNLGLIRELVTRIVRRQGLPSDDADEFESFTRLRLIENDYHVLRSYSGAGELRAYLTVVVHRFFVDFLNERWGKFRSTAAARRMGPVAEALEELVRRD